MVKALADRLAEAFAEFLHARVRREWGYGAGEQLSGGRPARGALPRHPAGVRLPGLPGPHREGPAVRSARGAGHRHGADRVVRDVTGGERQRLYFASPHAKYFSVGRIGRDQVESYAARKA